VKGFGLRMVSIAAALALAAGVLASPFGLAAARADDLSISGRVVGSAGSLGGIAIGGCTTDWMFCSDTVLTDDAGNFSLGGLVAGSYILLVQTGPAYLSGYYQGPGLTQEFWSATPVDVTGGVVLPDIQLTTAFWISGVVSGSAGGLGSMHAMACPTFGYAGCSTGTIDDSGSYSVGGLEAGIYYLEITSATGAPGGALSGPYVSGIYTGSGLSHQLADAALIDVTSGNVVLPPFEIPLGVSITGTLSGAAGNLGGITVSASEDDSDTAAYAETQTDAGGSFTLGGLWPGSYRIYIQDWSGTYVSGTYTPDGLVQSDLPHETVGPDGLDLGTIPLELASSLSGTLTGAVGQFGSVYPMACRSDGLCYSGLADDSGSFSVTGLAPGDYILQFDDWAGNYFSGYYSDSGVEAPDAAEATLLSVPPSVAGLSLALNWTGRVGVPAPPTNVVAVPGDGTADVTWTAPLYDGGAPIFQYIVTASDGTTCYSATTECMVGSLTNGQSYTFAVVAQNREGLSQPSAPSDPVTPNPPPPAPVAVRLTIAASPDTVTAGGSVTVTVSALDQDGNVVPSYAGTVSFSSSDPWSGLPDSYTFTQDDAGAHQFTIYLGTAGPQTVRVDDGAVQGGETTVMVTPGPAANLVIGGPMNSTAGVAQKYTVTATDGFGNLATGFSGRVKIRSTDASLAAPAYVKLANGRGTFRATFKTAGYQVLSLGDLASGPYGEAYVQVDPAKAARFVISGAPHGTEPGEPISLTVTALDRYGNVATGYAGTIRFTSNDRAAVLPASYTFTARDAGVHAFTVTLKSPGLRWVRVMDTSRHPIGGLVRIQVVRLPKGLH
jgi:hypothetical protein